MPELPEVETVRRALAERVMGRVVVGCALHRRDVLVVPGDPIGGFARNPGAKRPRRTTRKHLLLGGTLTEPVRRGKQLALACADGRRLLIHLGMTGQVLHAARGRRLAHGDHHHATLRLDDGARLVFRDPRRFGGLWAIGCPEELERRWAALGPDALGIGSADLVAALSTARRPIKAVLLDQTRIAGIGNIYADEALFAAGIHPLCTASSIGHEQAAALARAVRRTLGAAIAAGGSTIRDYTDPMAAAGGYQRAHLVYGRGGEPCARCGGVLERLVVAQRTTVCCPRCQVFS
mgnify:FL=1